MIEVRPAVAVVSSQAVSVSSQGTFKANEAEGNSLPKADNILPSKVEEVESTDEAKGAKLKSDNLEETVASLNDFVQSVQRDLQFSVDKELDLTVIKVIDGGSGELIRQIPEETFLELARKLNEDGVLNLFDAMG